MPGDPYYTSTKHKEWREKVLRRDGYLCQECKKYGRNIPATHAHHIKSRDEYPELQYRISNGISLCAQCHNKLEPRIPPDVKKFCDGRF